MEQCGQGASTDDTEPLLLALVPAHRELLLDDPHDIRRARSHVQRVIRLFRTSGAGRRGYEREECQEDDPRAPAAPCGVRNRQLARAGLRMPPS